MECVYGIYDVKNKEFLGGITEKSSEQAMKKGADVARKRISHDDANAKLSDRDHCKKSEFIPILITEIEAKEIKNLEQQPLQIDLAFDRLMMGQMILEDRLALTFIS